MLRGRVKRDPHLATLHNRPSALDRDAVKVALHDAFRHRQLSTLRVGVESSGRHILLVRSWGKSLDRYSCPPHFVIVSSPDWSVGTNVQEREAEREREGERAIETEGERERERERESERVTEDRAGLPPKLIHHPRERGNLSRLPRTSTGGASLVGHRDIGGFLRIR